MVRLTDRPAMTIAVDLGCKATKQTKNQKKDQTKILMTNGSLMQVKSIAECSPWSILQYF